jgi:hypothetical protein
MSSTWNGGIRAGIASSPIIPAGIGIAQNAKPWRTPNGWTKGRRALAGSMLPRRLYAAAEDPRLDAAECARDHRILFREASETLLTIVADPPRLGAAIGFLVVLHLGQNLHLHPHLALRGSRRRLADWRHLCCVCRGSVCDGKPQCCPCFWRQVVSMRDSVCSSRNTCRRSSFAISSSNFGWTQPENTPDACVSQCWRRSH